MGVRLAACAIVVCATADARAQTATTGAVAGSVKTAAGAIVSDVIVTVSDDAGVVGKSTSDFTGRYRIVGIPPGRYRIAFHLRGTALVRGEVEIRAGAVTMLPVRGPGEPAPGAFDPSSAALETVIGRELLDHRVRTGFDFDAALGVVPGAQGDDLGISFNGADSLENRYVVDDVDVTGVVYPTLGSTVPLELIDSLQVITGGASAASGGFTGARVRAVTRRGGNTSAGAVFASIAPGALMASREREPSEGQSIEARTERDLDLVAGAELSGPIVRDRAWYWVAVAPRWRSETLTRTTRRQADCRTLGSAGIAADQPCGDVPRATWAPDGVADVDPATGFAIYEDLDHAAYDVGARGVTIAAKLDAAVKPEHQGGLSVQVTPRSQRGVRTMGSVEAVATRELTTDIAARWTSRFTSSVLSAVIGLHRSSYRSGSADGRDDVPLQELSFGDLGSWGERGSESAATVAGCADDGADDPYPEITNCPLSGYAVGGPGALTDDVEQRLGLQLAAAHRVRLGGFHTFQVGLDLEDARASQGRRYSGDRLIRDRGGEYVLERYVEVRDPGAPGTAPCSDGVNVFGCDASNGAVARASAFNRSFYFEDVWRPLTELAIELGIRADSQTMGGVELLGMASPRVGIAYDWTEDGRSRLFWHWGEYDELVPLSLGLRAFNGVVSEIRTYDAAQCIADGASCDPDDPDVTGEVFAPTPQLVDPDLWGQHLSETILGVEREVWRGVTFGFAHVRRSMNRIIEDVGGEDGALVIANPGEHLAIEVDPGRRTYHALQFKLSARISRRWTMDASYVWSRSKGNYPGLWSPNNDQIQPNTSSQYDLPELLANRDGHLPQDRPHYLKLDGFYTFGGVTLGGRARLLSGTPIDVLGPHSRYGTGEVFVLPRGAAGRTDLALGLDLHVDYERDLGHGVRLGVFLDVLNVANHQGAYDVDENYTYLSSVDPIVGGSYEDLVWAKEAGTDVPIQRNPNFGRTSSRYAPLGARLGARLTF